MPSSLHRPINLNLKSSNDNDGIVFGAPHSNSIVPNKTLAPQPKESVREAVKLDLTPARSQFKKKKKFLGLCSWFGTGFWFDDVTYGFWVDDWVFYRVCWWSVVWLVLCCFVVDVGWFRCFVVDLAGFWFTFFFFLNFWVCVLESGFVFLLFLFMTHLDLNSYDF